MKAIRVHEFGGPEVMQLEEVPDLTPAAGEVFVRVRAIGVNPVDSYIRSGQYPAKPPLPFTPGSDAAGVVDSVGKVVTRVRPGDSVYVAGTMSGAYAQQALCSESQVHRLPSHITFEQGAAVGIPYATAFRALFQRALLDDIGSPALSAACRDDPQSRSARQLDCGDSDSARGAVHEHSLAGSRHGALKQSTIGGRVGNSDRSALFEGYV